MQQARPRTASLFEAQYGICVLAGAPTCARRGSAGLLCNGQALQMASQACKTTSLNDANPNETKKKEGAVGTKLAGMHSNPVPLMLLEQPIPANVLLPLRCPQRAGILATARRCAPVATRAATAGCRQRSWAHGAHMRRYSGASSPLARMRAAAAAAASTPWQLATAPIRASGAVHRRPWHA